MWQPVSRLEYIKLDPDAQVLVVACPMRLKEPEIRKRWGSRATAAIGDSSMYLADVVRDLLANPHVRIVVFDGEACGRQAYERFWRSDAAPVGWGIQPDHISLVRQFVDLYDDDFGIKGPMPPYWPTRIRYYDDKENT